MSYAEKSQVRILPGALTDTLSMGDNLARLQQAEHIVPRKSMSDHLNAIVALSKTFPASDWHEAKAGQKCSRWGCKNKATKSRNTGQGEMGACSMHYSEMKKD